MKGGFTGRHMAGAMIGFFSVVIGVNLLMATQATRTFGGTVVDNSYIASQKFNRWLDEAAAERQLGWTVAVARDGDHALLRVSGRTGAVADARVTAIAEHPLGRRPDLALRFEYRGDGRYVSTEPLPAGRWRLRIEVREVDRRARFIDEVAG